MQRIPAGIEAVLANPGPPADYTEIELGMTNVDHTIDDGFADALQSGRVFGRHAAWNFNGIVWWDGAHFREQVWVYRQPKATFSADTLNELMTLVNEHYGTA